MGMKYKQLARIADLLDRQPDDEWFADDLCIGHLHSLQLLAVEFWAMQRYQEKSPEKSPAEAEK